MSLLVLVLTPCSQSVKIRRILKNVTHLTFLNQVITAIKDVFLLIE